MPNIVFFESTDPSLARSVAAKFLKLSNNPQVILAPSHVVESVASDEVIGFIDHCWPSTAILLVPNFLLPRFYNKINLDGACVIALQSDVYETAGRDDWVEFCKSLEMNSYILLAEGKFRDINKLAFQSLKYLASKYMSILVTTDKRNTRLHELYQADFLAEHIAKIVAKHAKDSPEFNPEISEHVYTANWMMMWYGDALSRMLVEQFHVENPAWKTAVVENYIGHWKAYWDIAIKMFGPEA